MGYKVVLMPRAIRDIEDIVAYIARDNPEAAEKLGTQLIDRALSLSSFPHMGPTIRRLKNHGVRQLVEGDYLIPYQIQGNDEIHVFRFWHAARGNPQL